MMKKIFKNNTEFIFSFAVWIATFWGFLSGKVPLRHDAPIYYQQTGIFIKNLSQGIFPLWNASWSYGIPNNFFLQRIGAFNPFYSLLLIFNKIGLPFLQSYLFLLMIFHFVGCMGFYALGKKIFKNKTAAFLIFLILLFSSVSSNLFTTYTHLIFVPGVWLFYFIVSMTLKPKIQHLLGSTLCLILLMTTYIPFYFIIIFSVFLLFYMIFFMFYLKETIPQLLKFLIHNKLISILCLILIFCSLIPGYWLYKEGAQGEIIMPTRHYASVVDNTLAVDFKNLQQFGTIAHLYFNRQFGHFKDFQTNMFFLPLWTYLMFFLCLITPMTRFNLFLLAWGLTLFIFSSPDLFPKIYNFLFNHFILFKFIRMVEFYLWLIIAPIFIFFLGDQIKKFFEIKPETKIQKLLLFIFLTLTHICFAFFLYMKKCDLWTGYLVVIASWIMLNLYFFKNKKIPIFIFMLVIIFQPIQTFYFMTKNTAQISTDLKTFEPTIDLPRLFDASRYYLGYHEPFWNYNLLNIVPERTVNLYAKNKFILYDQIQNTTDKNVNVDNLNETFSAWKNVAYAISDKPIVLNHSSDIPLKAQPVLNESNQFQIIKTSFNGIKIKTNFKYDKFLVYTTSYDKNWKGRINNKPIPIIQTNLAFCGIKIPAGKHIIEYHYGNWSNYLIYWFLWAVTHILFICIIFFTLKRNLWAKSIQ